jgi:hypothetical protein
MAQSRAPAITDMTASELKPAAANFHWETIMRHFHPAVLLLWLAFGLAGLSGPAQAETAAQAYAQQTYNAYLAAHEQTWRATAQGLPNEAYVANERYAWEVFIQAQNAANAEQNQILANYYLAQQVAQIDTAMYNWSILVRTIYDRRDVNGWNNDPVYRAGFHQWAQNWIAYANNVYATLAAYRQQLVGSQNPPAPPQVDPRYTGADFGPVAVSYDPSRGYGPLRQ